jgi:HlyD family secretion protein
VQPSSVVGEVEAVKANVISLHDGLVAELHVDLLQHVTNGQVIGTIISTDPDILKASIAAIESDLKVLQARMRLDERRNEQSVQQVRLDLMTDKMDLVIAVSMSNLASNKLKRAVKLVHDQVESQDVLDIAQADFDRLQAEISARGKTIAEKEAAIKQLEGTQGGTGNDSYINAAIRAKEDELEATLKPSDIRAPMDGVISAIYRRGQERVVRGESIVTISSTASERIIGYIRQPVQMVPNPDIDVVVVRTRTLKRQMGEGQILRVGSQYERINPLLISTDSNRFELGLPIVVSLPKGMNVAPGEFLDLSIRYAKR